MTAANESSPDFEVLKKVRYTEIVISRYFKRGHFIQFAIGGQWVALPVKQAVEFLKNALRFAEEVE